MSPRRYLALLLGFACLSVTAWSARRESPADSARAYVARHLDRFGLSRSDIREMTVSSEVRSAHTGVTHVYLQQRYRGIEVHGAILNVNVAPDGTVASADSRFFREVAAAAGNQRPRRAALEAVGVAVKRLDLRATKPFEVLRRKGDTADSTTISSGSVARKPIDANLVWMPVDGAVRLAWKMEIEETSGEHWWNVFVDAETGEWLAQHDLIVHDSVHDIANAISHRRHKKPSKGFPETDGAAYNVFPLPFESPSDGDRELVENAADPSASPFGWHDTDGVSGPEFTTTQGNNVHAYADRDNDNVVDPGSDPDGGPGLLFDFPLDLGSRPLDSQPAMVTNLFYWNNIMHDVTYGYGFDEASGNFQVNNYGKGGVGADDVRAEAQDGSGRNNANFGTPPDGNRPRMQMFEWRSSDPNPITVHPPSPIADTYFGPMAGFGESLVTTGPLSGTVVLVDDGAGGAGVPTDGCEPFSVPAGAIPLMDRGACNFTVKVKNAQNAGAAVAIVANNIAGPPFGMGGADPTITIPSVMISLDDANLFKANLPLDATIADGTGGAPDRDSDLDAGVISHEYGHGVSNRLTGGPATVACLRNAEQMGEGWSDWFALNLTTHPDDTGTTPRGVGSYVIFQPPDGAGIRPTPYTTDMTVNPSTYASVADVVNISQPHGIGYVWNTMLWEVYWNLVDRHGYNKDIYADWWKGGNNLAMQLVMDGMKLQVCSPGFVDGRDAILMADTVLTDGENQCEIWRGFAKRGLGFSASQGSSNDRTDGVEAFDLPATCTAATFGGFRPPIKDAPEINHANAGRTIPVKFTLTGAGESFPIDSQPVDCHTLEPTGKAPTPIETRHMKRFGDSFFLLWETSHRWEDSCRRLTLRIPAASDAVAYFKFH
jgi:hypothetical protein